MLKSLNKTLLGAALIGVSFASHAFAETTLNALFMAQAAYSEADVRAMTDAFTKANPDIKVNLEFVPYEGLHDKTVLAQGSGGGYDVVLFDVIWPAEYATNKVLVDVSSRIPDDTKKGVLPGAWTTVQYDSKYYGMPWILDTKYLFYNKEILEKAGIKTPPKTWDELTEQAKIIKDKGLLATPIAWSWSQAEAAICDYTTLVSAYKGDFLKDGKPDFQNGGGLDALKYMVSSYKSGLTNPNSKEFLEEDVRKVFENGDAAFALNWTYMYNMANDPKDSKVAGKVGVVPAPGVAGKSEASAVNGSMGLGITTASKHPDEAWKFITFMTSQATQNQYAKLSLPIWASSYSDPAVTKGQEDLIAAAKVGLAAMYPRPTTPKYQELSTALQQAIQESLLGQSSPEDALKSAAQNSGL
ncbi:MULTISPECIES: extracellular solute-binding protein [Rhizobium]|jgi:multiple sugar transport system substrate-binding protein|uniref:Carbohydrate ABC transporter substrate-binding protein, CUT1 family n=1 Tax=Rhizobium lusitanum TaxID=293958 RepID=A0A1C3X488_9HYPH|nr:MULTISPECIES: extracellular solute-binding protein [Rhizobium]NRP90388.1 putative ABC transporter-binding protein [Ensifer adhaerens]NKJ09307.1 multiple sugar transport system substrate-binding protein [Rhizobium sp. SG741]NKJ39716.1 multiple sugar transport system substrate-binding protein [Rhizobium sp. SG570]NTJ05422.1 extracellular solute-binding protein [Rhizobium lusitanum]SCB47063.1 carbohydrate ABC transporter substrate-binding protein, CUT1 family [Rhizobium lusitanum]